MILGRGKLLVYDTIANLQRSVDPSCRVRVAGDAEPLRAALAAAGARCEAVGADELRVSGVDDAGGRVLAAARRSGAVVREIVADRTSLEDIFMTAVRETGTGLDAAAAATAAASATTATGAR
jgi:hypothetical protein